MDEFDRRCNFVRWCGCIGAGALLLACPTREPSGGGEADATGSSGIVVTGADASGPKLDLGADTGVDGGVGEGGTGCDSELFGSAAVPPNVLIVLDRSGSMQDEIGGGTKWDIARQAIDDLTAAHATDVRWGLMLFPGLDQSCNDGAECTAGTVFIDPAEDTAAMISSFLDAADTCMFGTPIAENLDALVDYAGLEDTEHDNYILLVTDGMATCNDPVPSVTTLRMEDPEIQTFVVGFGSDVDPDQLDAMAQAGGTALPGDPKYYQADDANALEMAFADIAGSVLSCVFVLDEVPPDPEELYAFFDMMQVPRDPTHTNGWDYDPTTNTVTFYGAACDSIKNDAVETVNLVFGCPELPPAG
ncbi:MAG: VWA domain-containing protein [Deltaproteobacteria bacterium]|nr:VWA domain-containing protein [Deltaproteobacteria bacterium]MBK8241415.1 VWA domain-containing protein [Deltaproteobacteria bacterium]MBK8717129.1 VWA domain-containing protein [Deltaproteobacteria bacterium]MBP7286349.1 VWA domain-containing protein [Nannocystaceae bacterium]